MTHDLMKRCEQRKKFLINGEVADLVSGPHTVDEHLTLEPAPGHTPGTMFITLASHGARVVFCGDILHQAIQIFHPEWNSLGCQDSVNARRSRRLVLEKYAGTRRQQHHAGQPD